MRTVRDACVLQPNALSIQLSDQVEQLDELIMSEGDGSDYFAKTAITGGMRDLISEGLARLAGESAQAIFHLKQAMGGGKTHLLVGFGLLARHPELRRKYAGGVSAAGRFDTADIAAFNGRNNPESFFWGEIANQLGKGELFKAFWAGGPKAPDERDWLSLFDGDRPILILLDEMPPYFHYLDTQKVGGGTVADIATRAFANMLTAAGKKKNVCVVVSDLAAAYETGGKLINRALEDARSELGRQERNITPVDLAANEIYLILRKRLFVSLPDDAEIGDIAETFGRRLEEAAKAKTVSRGAEALADEIAATYPFHPRLKNVVALFKENDQFKQTRGLIELASRLLKSVWERPSNDVFLIGPQHFDLSISEVRDKLTEISGMRDVIARDIWDEGQSAHAQVIDLESGKEAATLLSSLLLTASLSTAVNAVKGLTREEMVECLVTPLREPSEFLAAFDELDKVAWYLHHTPEGRYYFDRQENLTKMLQGFAKDAPDPQIDELIRHRLVEMFKPARRTCYGEVLALPTLKDIADKIRQGRILIIVSPDSTTPPDDIRRFFDEVTEKNNLCVLTGEKTAMASIEAAARQHYAAQKADKRIPSGHPQREDLEKKQEAYSQAFNATILSLFDKVLFPFQRTGRDPQLMDKPLDMTRDGEKPFNGEDQIEKTLTSHPLKLYLDVDAAFDALRDKAQDLLWPENQDETRWADAVDRYAQQAGMPWLPPKGLDSLKSIACNRGLWEDLGTGYVTRNPRKKTTSAQIIEEPLLGDAGEVRLSVHPQNAGPAPRIYYAEESTVTEQSPILKERAHVTSALRVQFLVRDPSGQYETGVPVTWSNQLALRTNLQEEGEKRSVELRVAPRGTIRFTIDGSEPRDGSEYTAPIAIGDAEVLVRAFAQADGLEAKKDFKFPARGKTAAQLDPVKPATLQAKGPPRSLDSRGATFDGLRDAKDRSATFEGVLITVGQGARCISVSIGEIPVEPAFIEDLLARILEKFQPDAPVAMSFRRAVFKSGHDLQAFADRLGITLRTGDVEQ
jgi:hypothetical protein